MIWRLLVYKSIMQIQTLLQTSNLLNRVDSVLWDGVFTIKFTYTKG